MQSKKAGLGLLKPTPRIITFILLSTLVALSRDWVSVLFAFFGTVIILLLGRKFPRAALIATISAFILTLFGHGLTATDPNAVSFWIFHVSAESFLKGFRLGLRLVAMILPAVAFIAVTPLNELLDAFVGLRIPQTARMYLTIVLRYVDILWYDIQISMKAMAVRGVNWDGSFVDKVPAFQRLMLPLIFRILDHVDGQSLAIDNRGGIKISKDEAALSSESKALTMKNVYVRYDKGDDPDAVHALSDINISVEKSESIVLLGPIGAGKTSTMLLAVGLIPISTGRMKGDVEIFGENTKRTTLSTLGRLGRVVFPSAVQGLVGLTVEGELDFSLRSSNLTKEEKNKTMVAALETVGLDASFLPRTSLGLSGGEMQRVALASAIVSKPRLLALDDVTVQLDPVGKREVVSALRSLAGEHITTIITDPYVDLLSNIGTRFVSLSEGRITSDESELKTDAIRKANVRVPQIRLVEEIVGVKLPETVEASVHVIKAQGIGTPKVEDSEAPENKIPYMDCKELTYQYPDSTLAIKGLDVKFGKGEFIAILGSNGSGKTTLALMLAGGYQPTSGSITFIDGDSSDKSRVGYVFQEPVNQIVTMKVRDELAFGPRQLKWDQTRIDASVDRELERFSLNAEDVPLHLSPAAARKLAVAATLTMEPGMVILDEPTNNLDVAEVDHLMAHLETLQSTGTTVVLITHDIEVACEHADRVIVMSKGKIIADGPTREVMSRQELLASSDVIVPPIVDLSLHLWPNTPPALTINEFKNYVISSSAE